MHLFRIPQCSIQNRIFWMEHCGIWNRCILGFVKSVYSLNHLSWNYSHWALYINTVIRGERISIMEIRLAILPYLYHGDSCSYLWTRHEWDFAVASHHESHRARSRAPLHVTEGKRTRFPSDPHPFCDFDNWKWAVTDWLTSESRGLCHVLWCMTSVYHSEKCMLLSGRPTNNKLGMGGILVN